MGDRATNLIDTINDIITKEIDNKLEYFLPIIGKFRLQDTL